MRIQSMKNQRIPGRKKATAAGASTSTESATGTPAAIVSIGPSSRASAIGGAISARLEQVRAQLRDNAYPIDFDKLAHEILADELERRGVA